MAKDFFTYDQYQAGIVEKPKRKNFKDLTGMVNDNITVLNYAGVNDKSQGFWWCVCSCTNDRYFKVNATSLKRKITKSCGCNYKNNGNSKPSCKEVASAKLDDYLVFTKFNGWDYPCTIECSICGKVEHFSKANNARGYNCCYDSEFDTIDNNLKEFGYKYLGNVKAQCLSCGITRDISTIREECPCNKLPNTNDPSAVYFLKEEENTWLKIGKSDNPSERHHTINNSARKVNYNFLQRVKTIWVKGYKAAYRLETMLHQHFSNKRVNLPKFDGSTEVFEVSLDQVEDYLTSVKDTVDKLVLEGYTEPAFQVNLPEHTINQSIEWNGFWYKGKSHLIKEEGLSEREFEKLGHIDTDYQLFTRKLKHYRDSERFRVEQHYEKQYGRDWGDGLFGTMKGLSRKYGHEDGTIWHRVNKLGLSMKEALYLPKGSIDHYWKINNKWYHKRELCNSLGIKKPCVTLRIQRGIPLKYAILPERWALSNYKDSIFNLNGDCFWWADLKLIFGCKYSIGKVLHKYGTVKGWLEQEYLLKDDDYFEEILFKRKRY